MITARLADNTSYIVNKFLNVGGWVPVQSPVCFQSVLPVYHSVHDGGRGGSCTGPRPSSVQGPGPPGYVRTFQYDVRIASKQAAVIRLKCLVYNSIFHPNMDLKSYIVISN